jgi:TldD protein
MLKDYITAFKSAFTERTELRAQRNKRRVVYMANGNIISNFRKEDGGFSARVYKNGVYGFASSADYSPENIEKIIRYANENTLFLDSKLYKNVPALPVLIPGKRTTQQQEQDPEQKLYIDIAKQADDYITAHCPKIVARSVVISVDSMEKLLTVSNGFDSYSLVPRIYMYVYMTAPCPDGSTVEVIEIYGGRGYALNEGNDTAGLPADFEERTIKQYEKVLAKADGVFPDAGVKDVILSPEMSGILVHEAVGHTVEADIVLMGSAASASLGKPVASELVTMVDYAYKDMFGNIAPLPVYVDDEGTPAENATLIENGVLVGYMNSRETALHYGQPALGNARAYAFSDEPIIRMRNTAMLPGKSSFEDMIAAVDDGYYVSSTGNGQADTTGEFTFGVTMGYEIKHGKLGRAIRDTTISGVAFEMLKTVDMLSDQMEWFSSGMCGKKQPIPVGLGGPHVKCKVNIGGR